MKSSVLSITGIAVLGVAFVVLLTTASAPAVRARTQTGADPCTARLATFDTLDFDVFSNQKWPRLSESHANDIVVTWPDGHETSGIARHIEDLKGMFVYAPNTNIAVHPIRICSGRSEEHTSELQSHSDLVCRLLLEKKNKQQRKNKHA